MADLEELSRAVDAYRYDDWSLDQFADWFRSASRRKFAESQEVRAAILEIDALFSRLDFEGLGESDFREELANAIAPFASGPVYALARKIVIGDPQIQARSASWSFRRAYQASAA
jgi:hypothetical protein